MCFAELSSPFFDKLKLKTEEKELRIRERKTTIRNHVNEACLGMSHGQPERVISVSKKI